MINCVNFDDIQMLISIIYIYYFAIFTFVTKYLIFVQIFLQVLNVLIL